MPMSRVSIASNLEPHSLPPYAVQCKTARASRGVTEVPFVQDGTDRVVVKGRVSAGVASPSRLEWAFITLPPGLRDMRI